MQGKQAARQVVKKIKVNAASGKKPHDFYLQVQCLETWDAKNMYFHFQILSLGVESVATAKWLKMSSLNTHWSGYLPPMSGNECWLPY